MTDLGTCRSPAYYSIAANRLISYTTTDRCPFVCRTNQRFQGFDICRLLCVFLLRLFYLKLLPFDLGLLLLYCLNREKRQLAVIDNLVALRVRRYQIRKELLNLLRDKT